jgi:hypothetical protein
MRSNALVQQALEESKYSHSRIIWRQTEMKTEAAALLDTQYLESGYLRSKKLDDVGYDDTKFKAAWLLRRALRQERQFFRFRDHQENLFVAKSTESGLKSCLLCGDSETWIWDVSPFVYMEFLEKFFTRGLVIRSKLEKTILPKRLVAMHLLGLERWEDSLRYSMETFDEAEYNFLCFASNQDRNYPVEAWLEAHKLKQIDARIILNRLIILFLTMSSNIDDTIKRQNVFDITMSWDSLRFMAKRFGVLLPKAESWNNTTDLTSSFFAGMLLRFEPDTVSMSCSRSTGWIKGMKHHLVRVDGKIDFESVFGKMQRKLASTRTEKTTKRETKIKSTMPKNKEETAPVEEMEQESLIVIADKIREAMLKWLQRSRERIRLFSTPMAPKDRLANLGKLYWRQECPASIYYQKNMIELLLKLDVELERFRVVEQGR